MDDTTHSPRTENAEYQDLSLVLTTKAGGGYTARVYDGLPQEGNTPVVTEELLPLFDERLDPPRKRISLDLSPCQEALDEMGDYLCRFLLTGQVRELFFQRVEEVGRQESKKLRVRLCWKYDLFLPGRAGGCPTGPPTDPDVSD